MNEEQKQMALLSKKKLEETSGKEVMTFIHPMTVWTNAENYHQKYYLRGSGKFGKIFQKMNDEELRESTAAAKVNAYCGQNLSLQALKEELESMSDLDPRFRESILSVNSFKQTESKCH